MWSTRRGIIAKLFITVGNEVIPSGNLRYEEALIPPSNKALCPSLLIVQGEHYRIILCGCQSIVYSNCGARVTNTRKLNRKHAKAHWRLGTVIREVDIPKSGRLADCDFYLLYSSSPVAVVSFFLLSCIEQELTCIALI